MTTNLTAPNQELSTSPTQKSTTIERTATANWKGTFKEGNGILSTQSEVLKEKGYNYKARFEDGLMETNPEELLAASHAACFTMSVAFLLSKKQLNPNSLETLATVTLEGLNITKIHLKITGSVEGIDADSFTQIAKEAETGCLISKIINVPISSEAHFVV